MTEEISPVVDIEQQEYIINMGPQHPSTHGVLRLVVSLQGEIVKNLQPHIGYIHRGIEKMCESLTYPQIIHLTDRMDYLSAHMNNEALCLCVENALGVEVPERVKAFKPDLLFWICGMDTHQDSYGTQALTSKAYPELAEIIIQTSKEACDGKLIVKTCCNAPPHATEYIVPRIVDLLAETKKLSNE